MRNFLAFGIAAAIGVSAAACSKTTTGANSASGVSQLNGVSCVSTQTCFAVGADKATPEGPFQGLIEAGAIQPSGGFGFVRF